MEAAFRDAIGPLGSALELLSQVDAAEDDFIFVVDRNLLVRPLNHSLEIPTRMGVNQEVVSLYGNEYCRQILDVLRPMFGFAFEAGRRLSHEGKVSIGGREAWFDARFTPIMDTNGRVTCLLGISREITDRKRKEELLSRSREEWVRAIDTLPYAMAAVDADFRITKVNVAMARQLGVTVREAVGLTCYKHIRGLTMPPGFCPLLRSAPAKFADKANFSEENERGQWPFTVHAINDAEGKLAGCLYVGRDQDGHREAASRNENNKQIMRQFLAKADHVVLIQDREGTYVFASSVPGNGASETAFVGKTPSDFFEPDEASRLLERIKTVADTGLELSEEREWALDGEMSVFFDRISAIRDSQGNVKQVVTVSKRVSRSKSPALSSDNLQIGTQTLSARESEVLKLIAAGLTNRQIAERLYISKKTVETHRARIMQKLGIHKASALVKYAVQLGIV